MQHRGKNIEFKKRNGNLVARKVAINKRIKIKSRENIKIEKRKISSTGTEIRVNKRDKIKIKNRRILEKKVLIK